MKVNLFLVFLLGTKKMATEAEKKSLSTISTLRWNPSIMWLTSLSSMCILHAFFSVPIHKDHQKYLKFMFGNLFQFTPCLMAMDFLWEYLLNYQKYFLNNWEAKVTTQLYMKLSHIFKEMRISLALLTF